MNHPHYESAALSSAVKLASVPSVKLKPISPIAPLKRSTRRAASGICSTIK
jgi:hypothetical protein